MAELSASRKKVALVSDHDVSNYTDCAYWNPYNVRMNAISQNDMYRSIALTLSKNQRQNSNMYRTVHHGLNTKGRGQGWNAVGVGEESGGVYNQ